MVPAVRATLSTPVAHKTKGVRVLVALVRATGNGPRVVGMAGGCEGRDHALRGWANDEKRSS
eukprot:2842810-Pleurochrysis_carterae.AAC.5